MDYTNDTQRTIYPETMPTGAAASYDVRIAHDLDLWPNDFKLANTIEDFVMPLDVAGQVMDKSSFARVGVSAYNTWLDPGWRGNLTVELCNHGPNKVHIARGDPLVQIVFWRLDAPTLRPYTGKYMDQPRRPVGPRYSRDDGTYEEAELPLATPEEYSKA